GIGRVLFIEHHLLRGASLGARRERRWRLLAWLETADFQACGRRCRLLLARYDRGGDLWCGRRQTHRRREEIELFSARHRTVGKRLLPSACHLHHVIANEIE